MGEKPRLVSSSSVAKNGQAESNASGMSPNPGKRFTSSPLVVCQVLPTEKTPSMGEAKDSFLIALE
jgi:hypothetical protein